LSDNLGILFNKEIRQELKTLSNIWKPFDPSANKQYTSYRHSARELYADAVSVLFNDPSLLRQKAPKFYDAFLNYMNRKPEFHAKYNDILDRIHGGKAVENTSKRIDDMHARGEETMRQRIENTQGTLENLKNWSDQMRVEYIDAFDNVLQRVKQVGEKTIRIEDNPRFKIENALYGGAETELHLRGLKEQIIDPLEKTGLNFKDFDKWMF